ncbi:hypothetical protein ACFQY4_07665 [Catellatospora bangladeshensis]|uniref:hypothetical protein n=1 Tax=Catellatospora bangladeshensis TaxID=310355 RepID=UPI001EF3CC4A|nr:hypothetical protein [Catellatospora bangladeshensis]
MSPGAVLPAAGHVHSEWSWDAYVGSMERTCARAVELGLPAVAFTWPTVRSNECWAPCTACRSVRGSPSHRTTSSAGRPRR